LEINVLSRKDRITLLTIARTAIKAKLNNETLQFPKEDELTGISAQNGAFVTLHKHGMLRGCIGNFISEQPLYKLVAEMACAAAFNDPRFPPLSMEEMDEIDIEISVLSPLEPCKEIETIIPGKHGIYLIRGLYRGVLLPQVATEYGWDRETFLDQTCIKAGMQPGCWRSPDTQILIFTAEIFGEISEGIL
jgi:AmmeMemoRadiSam system protein A